MPKPISEILKSLQSKPLVRTFTVDRKAVDEEKRTIQVAFASDKPVDHGFVAIALTMTKKAMRSERLKAGAPLLMDHDWRDQVGVVEGFSIGTDGIARAIARFGESARANEIFRDVQTGIRKSISVGFVIHKLDFVKDGRGEKDGLDLYRSDDWEPYEISIVSVPADISVGVGRSKHLGKGKQMENENEERTPSQAEEIIGFGKIFGEDALARQLVLHNADATVKDLMALIRAKQPPSPAFPAPMDPQFAAARANAAAGGYQESFERHQSGARTLPRHGNLKAFTGEGGETRAYRFGKWLLAGPAGNRAAGDWCQRNGVMLSRAMTEGVNEKGGYLVPDEFGQDIVTLMERYGIFRQHAHIVPMSSDHRTDPVLNGELDSQFIGEYQEGTDQDLDIGSIGYTAKKHMILTPYSSELSEDSVVSMADQIANAAARAFSKKEDLCGFTGDATSTYGGMSGIATNLKAVNASPALVAGLQVGSGNLYSELVLTDFEGVVGRLPDYADIGQAKWFVSRKFYFNVMVKLLLSGSPTATEIEDARNRKFLGYPVVFTQVMPSTEANSQVCALFGDLSQGARLADRRTITVAIDESLLFRKDALLFRATSRFDVNSAFGVGDTTDAGPIVGLITAAS